jgi:glycosyltransferase involved in cell wall biosynthesis
LRSENFLLLAGRINNLVDFEKVVKYCLSNQIDIYIIGGGAEELGGSVEKLARNVKLLGSMPHEEVLNYIEKCMAGIVLYENSSVNQSLSASTKLFEFLYFGKPVICSNNPGLLKELKSAKACYCSVENLIETDPSYFFEGALNVLNNNFTFESEMGRYFKAS